MRQKQLRDRTKGCKGHENLECGKPETVAETISKSTAKKR